MKAVIIGGGIAGLTMALKLKKNNWEMVVCEKSIGFPHRGHAFLMNYDGIFVLSEFFEKTTNELMKQHINLFSLKRPNNEEKIKIQLLDWYCMKRIELISFLRSFFTDKTLKEGRSFSHFLFKENKAIAAVFENGEIENGDLFIGADGSNSKVREVIHGKTKFSTNKVNEVVGVATKKLIIKDDEVIFQKFQSEEKGLAFGYIPSSADEVVWFLQYDVRLSKGLEENNPESIKDFCTKIISNFPEDIHSVLAATDFNNAYIWKTKDFDVLPNFHQNNIVLIGDAAHLALPFTSAGTTNALVDAQTLADSLLQFQHLEDALSNYFTLRYQKVKSHTEQGRILNETFLNPKKFSERGFLLPLITNSVETPESKVLKSLKIIYFTDPICSTCWIIQPILRKLKLEYGEYVKIEYHMGGLLPSWKDYNKGIIRTPKDAAKHWEDVNESQKMILTGDVWIDDPLDSSFPPSIAFKAAQLQDSDKAISFLRRLKELVFIEKKNIAKWEIIEVAALQCGLDSAVLKSDIERKGKGLFEKDLALAKKYDIKMFPTLFFYKDGVIKETIKGYQPYERFENIVLDMLPSAAKANAKPEIDSLFTMFHNMTEEEFSFLSDTSIEETRLILNALNNEGKITKYESKSGVVWMLNLNKKI